MDNAVSGPAMAESFHVAGLVERLSHCACGEAYRDGLKPTQWSALRYFSQANRFSRTTTAFARFQGTTTAAASQTITALVERGLLVRTHDEHDGRKHLLSVTAKARTLLASDPLRTLAAAADMLDNSEQAELSATLERMLCHLMAQQGGTAFGYCQDCRFLQRLRRAGGASSGNRCAHLDESLGAEEIGQLCVNFTAAEDKR